MVLGSEAELPLRRGDRDLKLIRLARAYLRQAEARLKDAREAYEEANYPYAVRLSQECVELSIKATLRGVGVEYPKEHEVSDLLGALTARFPPWFLTEIPVIQQASVSLVKKRELAFYGGEEAFLSPEEVISQADAHTAVTAGERVFQACRRLMDELAPS